jgi:hypothetical protein
MNSPPITQATTIDIVIPIANVLNPPPAKTIVTVEVVSVVYDEVPVVVVE